MTTKNTTNVDPTSLVPSATYPTTNVDPTSLVPSVTYPTTNVDPTSLVSNANYDNLLSMIMDPADIQQMIDTSLAGGFSGAMDPVDIQQMIDTSLASGLSGAMDPVDIQQMIDSSLASGLEGVLDPVDIQNMIDASAVDVTPGGAPKLIAGDTDVDVGGTTVNVDLGGGDAPAMTQDELSQFLGQDPSAYLASQGGDAAAMDVDGDGTVTPAELEAYQGNVYQFDMPDAALSGVTDLNQMAIDYLSGTGEIPAIGNFMDDLSLKHERQAADLEQSIVNRGITDSSIADRMRADLSRDQTNQAAMLETNLMQQLVPLYSQTGMGYEALTDQDRAQSLGEFFQFLDRQTAENRWTDQQKSQALSLMLNAMGMGTINPQMPAFNIPAGQPGAGQSMGQLIGNLGAAYLQGGGALPSWLGG